MIPLVLLTLSAALPTVESGWQPLDGGGVMYIVRLSADDVTGLRTQMISHTVPPEVRDVRRIMLHSRQGRLPRQLPADAPAAAAPSAAAPADTQRWLVPLELEQQWLPYLQQDGLVFDVPSDSTDVGTITITLIQPAPPATPPAGQGTAGAAEPAFPAPPAGESTQAPPSDNPFAGRPEPGPLGPAGETTEGLVPVARPGEVSGGSEPAPGETFTRPSWMDREGPSFSAPSTPEAGRPFEVQEPAGDPTYGRRRRGRSSAFSDNWPSDFSATDRPPAASAEPPAAAPATTADSAATVRSPSDQVIPAQSVANDEAGRPWLPLTAAVLILLVSLAANVYLGWVSWESRERYRHLLTQVHNPG